MLHDRVGSNNESGFGAVQTYISLSKKIFGYPIQTNPINFHGSSTFATPDLPGHWPSIIKTGHKMKGHGKGSSHKQCAGIWQPDTHSQPTPVISQRSGTGANFFFVLVNEKKSWPESTDENVVQSETVVEISGLSQGGHNRNKARFSSG